MSAKLEKWKTKWKAVPEQKSLTHGAENFLSTSYYFEIKKQ